MSIANANLFNSGFSESFRKKLRGWSDAANDAIRDRIVKNQDKYNRLDTFDYYLQGNFAYKNKRQRNYRQNCK